MMFGIWILWIVLIVLIVWGVKVFVDYTESRGKPRETNPSAMDILTQLYAKGEISKKEFEERKKLLSQ